MVQGYVLQIMPSYPVILLLSVINLGLSKVEGKHGNRYFYDPFSDWDREYYDASLEDLHLAAPPPPVPPRTPALQADAGFSLPPIPLPGGFSNGQQAGSLGGPLPIFGGPQYSSLSLYSSPSSPFEGGGPNINLGGYGGSFGGGGYGGGGYGGSGYGGGGYGGSGYGGGGFGSGGYGGGFGGGGYSGGGFGGTSLYGGNGFLNPVGGYTSGGRFSDPINSPFGGGQFGQISGGGLPQNIGGYGSQVGFGGNIGINIPPPFGSYTGASSLATYRPPIALPPTRPRPPPFVVRPFSNYDAPIVPENGGYPIVPQPNGPSTYVNYPVENQRPYNYIPFSSSNSQQDVVRIPSAVPEIDPNVNVIGPVIEREKLCTPSRQPSLTGICRSAFDVINRKVCLNMEIDGRSQECRASQLCCYWTDPNHHSIDRKGSFLPQRSLATSASRVRNEKIQPGYMFVSRESTPDNADYFRVGSRIIRPVDDESTKMIHSEDTHDESFFSGSRLKPTVPEAAAAERVAQLRLVPRTIIADGLPFTGRVCGKMGQENGRMGKILRGDSSESGELCWQAAIFSAGEFLCGGALVTSLHVITSARCLQKFRDGDLRNLTVVLGVTDVGSRLPGYCTRVVPAKRITIHPNFSSKTLANDIALIQLLRAVPTNNCTCTLCLPEAWTGPLRIDSTCLITGYGQSGSTSVSTYGKLRSAPVQIINSTRGPTNCQAILDSYSGMMTNYKLDPSMFCSISRDEQFSNGAGKGDACVRDNGAPLICALDADDPSRWTIAGIVTWGLGCGRTTETTRMPSVYTNIRRQIDWIAKSLI